MKSRTLTCITAMTLFVALAIPVRLGAQKQKEGKKEHQRYKLVDIGTFGGSASYLSCCVPVQHALNDRGIVTGWADISTPDPYSPNCFSPDCLVSHAFKWHNGVKTDLGALPGGSSSQALWINASGLIVGASQNGVIDPLLGIPDTNA
jgi:hypothetical protein